MRLLWSHLRKPDRAAVCCGDGGGWRRGKRVRRRRGQEGRGEKEGGLKMKLFKFVQMMKNSTGCQ